MITPPLLYIMHTGQEGNPYIRQFHVFLSINQEHSPVLSVLNVNNNITLFLSQAVCLLVSWLLVSMHTDSLEKELLSFTANTHTHHMCNTY